MGARSALSRTSRSPRDDDTGLSFSINDRGPRVPCIFFFSDRFSSSFSPKSGFYSPEYFRIYHCSLAQGLEPILRVSFRVYTLDRSLFFSFGIFFFDLLGRLAQGRPRGRWGRGYTKGDSSVYLRIAWRLSIEPKNPTAYRR